MILSVPNFANAEESKNLLDNFSDMEVNNNTKRYDLKGSFTIDRFIFVVRIIQQVMAMFRLGYLIQTTDLYGCLLIIG